MTNPPTGAREQLRRLLALVPYLQSREAVSLSHVAADFGVTPATIRADLNVLWFCGLPGLGMGELIDIDLEALETGDEVVRLSNAEYLTRPLRLDSTEASALVVALRTLREGSTAEERPIVERALARIEGAAGDGAALARHVEVLLPGSAGRVARLRSALERALRDRRQVRLGYYVPSRDEVTVRVVDPLALSSHDGHDYLDAWCHLAGGQRLFRMDRVSVADLLDTPALDHPDARPRNLDEGVFRASEHDTVVTLRLDREARWAAEYYPVDDVVEEAEGGLAVRLTVGDPAWLTRLVLRLGPHARVVSPVECAAAVREAAVHALKNYQRFTPYHGVKSDAPVNQ